MRYDVYEIVIKETVTKTTSIKIKKTAGNEKSTKTAATVKVLKQEAK